MAMDGKNTMRAARMHGNKDVRLETIPKPSLSPGKAIVQIAWCGICGSDLHEYLDGPNMAGGPGKPHPLTGEILPTVLGHEFCGTISAVNSGSSFKIGDKVMVDPRLNCKSCWLCSSKRDHQCAKFGFLGYSGFGGGFSEFCPVQESSLYVLPERVGLEWAALIEPLAVAHHAVKQPGIADYNNKSVLIVGGGPVGYAVILALRSQGAKKIIVSEPTRRRQEQLQSVADIVVDPTKEKVGDKCREVTDGKGVDVAFDCAGVPRGLEDAFDALVVRGHWVNVSLWEAKMTLPYFQFFMKELKLTASFCYNDQDFDEVIKLLGQGKFDGYQKMVTSRIQLEDVVSKGLLGLIENKDEHVKILVSPIKENIT